MPWETERERRTEEKGQRLEGKYEGSLRMLWSVVNLDPPDWDATAPCKGLRVKPGAYLRLWALISSAIT